MRLESKAPGVVTHATGALETFALDSTASVFVRDDNEPPLRRQARRVDTAQEVAEAERELRHDYAVRLARRHSVHHSLFVDCLRLSSASHLALSYYWTDAEITRNLWRDAPSEIAALIFASELARHFQLGGVAGFYYDPRSQCWKLKTIPCSLWRPRRDTRGMIFTVEVYRRAHAKHPFLLTSRGLPFGSSALARQERCII